MKDSRHHFTVTVEAAGQRLDKWLHAQCGELSRSFLQQLIAEGALTRDRQRMTSASARVKAGETYTLTIPEIKPLALEPVAMALDIIHEDEQLIVINKPAGLAVHPAPGTTEPTLVHGLLAHCGETLSGIGGVSRPGIVHRIDKDTSGLLVVAKTDAAHQHLSAQLTSRTLSRTYQAVCWGVPSPASGTIDAPIGRSPHNRKKMAVVASGKPARTQYRVERVFSVYRARVRTPLAAQLTVTLETGRTHQIRVHCAYRGCPLIGDPTYGGTKKNYLKKSQISLQQDKDCFLKQYRRQALHACMLTLHHPTRDKTYDFSAPLPEDMATLLRILEGLQA